MIDKYDSRRVWEMAFTAAIIGKSQSTVIGEQGVAERSAKIADHALDEYEKRVAAGKFGKEQA
jgi:hypothetical protein